MIISLLATAALAAPAADIVVATDAYTWKADTITQGEYKAFAVSPTHIESDYSARPGYYMPIEKSWTLKNDISEYPQLKTSNKLLEAVYNMGLDEMVNAVEPDTTLRTGKEWAGVWTRDVSYSIILSMAYLQPEASMISLMKKVNPEGQIIQDTGSGGAWPISTDRLVWALAAWEIYKVTGDREWLEKVYPIIVNSVDKDLKTTFSERGLIKGETSFIDWREQSYPRWMQTADIAASEAMGTNMVAAATMQTLADMAQVLGKKADARKYADMAADMRKAINDTFWLDDKGYYGMYTYTQDFPIMNPRAETLGESLAILYDIAPADRAVTITENNPTTPFGTAIFFPQIADIPNYHNNALWPFVGSYWALANAKAGNEEGTLEAIGAIIRPAALFATNKENFNLDNGDIFTELNSSNMLWSLSGNLALTNRILFGIHHEPDGLRLSPFVPRALDDIRTLSNFPYRGASLDITVEGYGNAPAAITLNGKPVKGNYIPASQLKGKCDIKIMMNGIFDETKVNRTANVKAPLTPIAWLEGTTLLWNPIEYIDHYAVLRDGEQVAVTRSTTFDASEPGLYQVIGYAADGTPSFASQPRSTRPVTLIQMPGETATLVSEEVSYLPADGVKGYTGSGFVETDHATGKIAVPVAIPADGRYSLRLRYANGNGPVNTENKAAIRTLTIDGNKAGTIVMPQRGVGNWDDWGASTSVIVPLKAGSHEVGIEFFAEDENMNLGTNHAAIDALEIVRID